MKKSWSSEKPNDMTSPQKKFVDYLSKNGYEVTGYKYNRSEIEFKIEKDNKVLPFKVPNDSDYKYLVIYFEDCWKTCSKRKVNEHMNSRTQNVNAILEGLNLINEGKRRENFVDMGLEKDEILPYIYRCIEFDDEDDAQTKVFYYKGKILSIKNGKSNPTLKELEQDIKKVKTSQDLYDITTRLEMITMW